MDHITVSIDSNRVERSPDDRPGAFEKLAAKELAQFVGGLLVNYLTDRQRMVLVMRYGRGETFDTIARRLRTTRQSVQRMHARALDALHRALESRSIHHLSQLL